MTGPYPPPYGAGPAGPQMYPEPYPAQPYPYPGAGIDASYPGQLPPSVQYPKPRRRPWLIIAAAVVAIIAVVAVITAVGPWNWLRLIASALLRTPAESSQAQVGQGTQVSVIFTRRRRFELDGDILGRTAALECRVEPHSLVVCTSPAAPAQPLEGVR